MNSKVEETTYGFDWGGVKIERVASVGEYKVIAVKTGRQELHLRITPSGLIRTNSAIRKTKRRGMWEDIDPIEMIIKGR